MKITVIDNNIDFSTQLLEKLKSNGYNGEYFTSIDSYHSMIDVISIIFIKLRNLNDFCKFVCLSFITALRN